MPEKFSDGKKGVPTITEIRRDGILAVPDMIYHLVRSPYVKVRLICDSIISTSIISTLLNWSHVTP